MYLYNTNASLWSTSNALSLPVRRRWFPQASSPARHQRMLQDHGYGLVYHVICLSLGTHSSLTTESRLRLSRHSGHFAARHIPRYRRFPDPVCGISVVGNVFGCRPRTSEHDTASQQATRLLQQRPAVHRWPVQLCRRWLHSPHQYKP